MRSIPEKPKATNRNPRIIFGGSSTPRDRKGPAQELKKGDYGRSTDYIVTAESFEKLAKQNPVEARSQIVMRLYEACSLRVYAFLRRSLPPDAAEDLTQETFLRLLQLRNLEKKSISISYLFRVAQNLVRRRYNLAARRRGLEEGVLRYEVELVSHANDPKKQLLALEAEHLEPAFETLVLHEQETIRLIVCEGMSYSEAAHILDVPVSTVNNWKHRALRKLRGFIDAVNDDREKSSTDRNANDARGDSPRSSRQQGPSTTTVAAPHKKLHRSERGSTAELQARAAG